MPAHAQVAHGLRQRYSLRWHGVLIGSFTLALMWSVSHLQMLLGVESLALRYAVTLTAGYVAYLLVLRAWAARLVRRPGERKDRDGGWDVPDVSWPGGSGTGGGGASAPLPRAGGGGNFSGGGATGNFGGSGIDASGPAGAGDAGALESLGDLAGGALEAAGSADEGAIVVVPVVAIFLIGMALVLGAGSLALLFFGWDVLLAVAVELAFSVATARAAVGVERQGWLGAAVRLTWKPLLGALVCAVALGLALDHFLPEVRSLPQAVRMLQSQ